jgi:hypothetical protein
VFGVIKRELRRRSAIEPVIGHMKAEGHLGRCYLKGRAGDAANAILSAVGYNFRRILAWLRALLGQILIAVLRLLISQSTLSQVLLTADYRWPMSAGCAATHPAYPSRPSSYCARSGRGSGPSWSNTIPRSRHLSSACGNLVFLAVDQRRERQGRDRTGMISPHPIDRAELVDLLRRP